MSTTGLVVRTRKKMNRMIVGLVLLLVLEFFVLTPFIGAYAIGVMVLTFLGGFWLGNKITEPLLEMGEEAIIGSMARKQGEDQKH